LKAYERLVLWLPYFDAALTRQAGRRVPLSQAVRAPTLEELGQAARRAGYVPEAAEAKHPRRALARTGYVMVERKKAKSAVLREIALQLGRVRGEGRT
jgi:signal recognition particle subunit SEC65